MRYYKINNITHTVFESKEEVPGGLEYVQDWRDSRLHDWAKADDGCIIQILRTGQMVRPKGKVRHISYLGTCTGTFVVSSTTKMDTSRRENIYSIGGNLPRSDRDASNITPREERFMQELARGTGLREAYLKVFPTNKPGYARMKAGKLFQTTRIRTAMKEELKPVCEKLNIDEEFILKRIKAEATTAEKPDIRLKALFKLADIMDLEDKNQTKITQLTGAVFQGFSDNQIEEAQRPKEIE